MKKCVYQQNRFCGTGLSASIFKHANHCYSANMAILISQNCESVSENPKINVNKEKSFDLRYELLKLEAPELFLFSYTLHSCYTA